ncbi:hypothetical protein JB92DRAFT_178968 [Gautieria morchelliformis]|nr:hypothetical protein JB92DRAFT_178968 [Gautieria morchelliformis]
MAPILLQRAPTTQERDKAGIIVDKRVLPTYNPGHYTPKLLPGHVKPLGTLDYVPPLEYFCIKSLYLNVDLVDLGGLPRFPFHPEAHMVWLRGLIPFFTFDMRDVELKYVDPRLWGTLIQLYSLPPVFHTYTLPLSDTHLTQLQAIRSTPDFTLITVLDLSSRCEITDETIGELKPLKNLCVLDLSLTGIGAWGVKKLSMCLVRKQDGRDERVGPWGIRIWSLRGCKKVDDSVKDALARFPLLSVVDLRDTAVTPLSHFPGFTSRPSSTHTALYYPNPPLSWINGLSQTFPGCRIFQSNKMDSLYVLHINKLEYPIISPQIDISQRIEKVKLVGDHDRVLALFPNGREALNTTHHLSQDHSQGDRVTKGLAETPQANRQPRDVYGSNG